jgi:hypothetical protein
MTYKITPLKGTFKWRTLVMVLMFISLYGCSTFRPDRWYLHNPANKELAEKAKSNWAPTQSNFWQDLLENQKLTSSAELQAQRALQETVVLSNHIVIINTPWSKLLENAKEFKATLEKEKEKLTKDKKQALDDKTKIGEIIKVLIKDTKSRENAVKVAQAEQWRWQAELILFEKATQGFLLQQAIKNRDIEGVEAKNTKNIFEEILKEEITTVDKAGKSVQTPISDVLPKEQLSLIKTLAENSDLSGWGKFLKNNGKQLDGIIDQPPPGITFQILSLGADLAKAKLDRENSIKNRLNEEIALFSKRETEIIEALGWANKAITQIGSKGFKREQNTTVFKSIQKSLKNKAGINTEVLIHKLQTYVLAEDLYTLSNNSFGVAKSALLHYYAIEDSAISAKEHEALLQRGLETLAVYHAGGITQEEINSILQAAQAVALGVISAGVL